MFFTHGHSGLLSWMFSVRELLYGWQNRILRWLVDTNDNSAKAILRWNLLHSFLTCSKPQDKMKASATHKRKFTPHMKISKHFRNFLTNAVYQQVTNSLPAQWDFILRNKELWMLWTELVMDSGTAETWRTKLKREDFITYLFFSISLCVDLQK